MKPKIVIAGAGGRMGRALLEGVLASPDLVLHGALDVPGSPVIGKDAGELAGRSCGVAVRDDVPGVLRGADVLIDFTQPAGTMAHVAACVASGTRLVIGTTGFADADRATIAAAARASAIVMAPNMSVGTNVMFKLLDVAARALDSDYDIEIIEAHHRHKVDAPSGTALRMGEVVAAATGRTLRDCAVYAREGHTGARDGRAIGFATVRGGDIVGEHTVMFAGEGERLELTIRSSSRSTYAQGALRAARWLAARSPGLYDMQDVLGLR